MKLIIRATTVGVFLFALGPGDAAAKRKIDEPKPSWPSAQSRCKKDAQCDAGLVCQALDADYIATGGDDIVKGTPLGIGRKVCRPGCHVGNSFHLPDEIDSYPNNCQSCQPPITTTAWTPIAIGSECRASAGICDVAETCNGSSGSCGADVKLGNETTCRSSAGVCDEAEVCDGSSNDCGTDNKLGNETTCRSSAGVCDTAEVCDGSSNDCGADVKLGNETTCRSAAGVCDADDVCNGSGNDCGADNKLGNETTCRSAAGVCDVAEVCDGSANDCGTDVKLGTETTCRTAQGQCDVAEKCNGSSADCPADGFAVSATACTGSSQGNPCDDDASDRCSGSANTCVDAFKASTESCRERTGRCDITEFCTGTAGACPADGYHTAQTVCRQKGEIITGLNSSNFDTGDLLCDVADYCTGASPNCPADGFVAAGTPCRGADGVCDLAEACSGASKNCPADAVQSEQYRCYEAGPVCDGDVYCDGTNGGDCPVPPIFAGVECRTSTGPCDPTEFCLGRGVCAPDAKAPSGTVCGNSKPCETAGTCNGTSSECVGAGFKSSATVCRPPDATNSCDLVDRCTGDSAECPADARQEEGVFCAYPARFEPGLGTCTDGFCDPRDCRWDWQCPDNFVCDTEKAYCIEAPVEDALGDACSGMNEGVCDPNSLNELDQCSSNSDCTPDENGVGGVCILESTCGALVTSRDYFCCAGMEGGGDGAQAQGGQSGRCQECCSTNDCFGDNEQCCDGRCISVFSDEHCGDCNYRAAGDDCRGTGDACWTGYECAAIDDEVEMGCIRTERRGAACGENQYCVVDTESDIMAACFACNAIFSVNAGESCQTNDDCVPVNSEIFGPATCVQRWAAEGTCDDTNSKEGQVCLSDAGCGAVVDDEVVFGKCLKLDGFCDYRSVQPGIPCSIDNDCKDTSYGLGLCDRTCATTEGVFRYETGTSTCVPDPDNVLFELNVFEDGAGCLVDSDCSENYKCVADCVPGDGMLGALADLFCFDWVCKVAN